MYAIVHAAQVLVQLICIERSKRSEQLGNGLQTEIECLVSAQLIRTHLFAPETFTVQTNIPVTEVVVHERIDQTSSLGRFEVGQSLIHALDQRVHL